MARVLVVDEDPAALKRLVRTCAFAGFQAASASNRGEALARLKSARPDIALVAVEHPDGDGMLLIRELKAASPSGEIPVIAVSSNGDPEVESLALQRYGADDFVLKSPYGRPIAAVCLGARLHKALREATPARLRAGQVALDVATRQVYLDGRRSGQLGERGAKLLACLIRNAGRPLPTRKLFDLAWPPGAENPSLVYREVHELRRVLGDADHALIVNVRGIGYLIPLPGPGRNP